MLPPADMTRRCILTPDDPAYPAQLLEIGRPPRELRCLGDPASLVRGLAVVGSRKASPYGIECATRFAGLAAVLGITIVSGGAVGCDLAAHRAALAAGAPTVVVLGCGADVDYPKAARDVLSQVRGGRGAVVSELDWGAPPVRQHFPARNRIIAGLASAVLVVEAALPSGTFSTADHALDAGREVFAVPGSVFFPGSAGCNRLIRQGAHPITCDEDLIDSLAEVGLLGSCDGAGVGCASMSDDSADALLMAIRADPMTPDRIADVMRLPAAVVLTRLASLEALGTITRYPDGRYGPCAHR